MIELKNVHKTYDVGESKVRALRGISLKISEGEFVAIMGPSGSGKSTLMHILGLLDIPTSGLYKLYGDEVSNLNEDSLALLRRDVVGFIFQQFNLLPRITVLENVVLPLIYSKNRIDTERAEDILGRVGLSARINHKSNELSGGEQQRVAIARSLINSPKIILADEPTGNLDSKNAAEIVDILKDLNQQGYTVILVTHEEEIGRQAKRLIKMRDGVIQSDEMLESRIVKSREQPVELEKSRDNFNKAEVWEFFRQGFKILNANKVRTGLSMLGILIGVAAVVAMLALGGGAQKAIENQLTSLGSNLLVLRPGAVSMGGVVLETGAATRLTIEDATNIREKIQSVKDVSGSVIGRGQVTYQDNNWNTQVIGAGAPYAAMRASTPEIGRFFVEAENNERSRVAVIGATIVREIFQNQNPIGEFIKINKVSFKVIGILPEKGATSWRDQDDLIVIPLLTAMHRLFGKEYLDYVDIEVADASQLDDAQEQIRSLLLDSHKIPPSQQQDAFQIHNMADIKTALSESSRTMSLLLSTIAAISLLVGGIGIMNIMLVSIAERTREIGLRKAVGARRFDILVQFLAESVVISAVGGVFGIASGWGMIELVSVITGWTTSISISSVILALVFSASIGIIFGLYPARKAAYLNPIDALRYE